MNANEYSTARDARGIGGVDLGPVTSEVQGLFMEPLQLVDIEPSYEQVMTWAELPESEYIIVDTRAIGGGFIPETLNNWINESGTDRYSVEPPSAKLYWQWGKVWDSNKIAIPRGISPHELLYGYVAGLHEDDATLVRQTREQASRNPETIVDDRLASVGPFALAPDYTKVSPLFGVLDEAALETAKGRYEAFVSDAREENARRIAETVRALTPIYGVLPDELRMTLNQHLTRLSEGSNILTGNLEDALAEVRKNYAAYCELSRLAERGEVIVNYTSEHRERTRQAGSQGWFDGCLSWVIDKDGKVIAPDTHVPIGGAYRDTWHVIGPDDLVVRWQESHSVNNYYVDHMPQSGRLAAEQRATLNEIETAHGLLEDVWGFDEGFRGEREAFARDILSRLAQYGLRGNRSLIDVFRDLYSPEGLFRYDNPNIPGSGVGETYISDGICGRRSHVLEEIPVGDEVLYVLGERYQGMDMVGAKIMPRAETEGEF